MELKYEFSQFIIKLLNKIICIIRVRNLPQRVSKVITFQEMFIILMVLKILLILRQ
jgi:hypothetical protein